MYVLAFGAKIIIFFEGGAPFWPPQKNIKQNHKNIFVLEELRCLQKTRAQKNEN